MAQDPRLDELIALAGTTDATATAILADTTAILADTTAIEADTTIIAADTTAIAADTTIIAADTTTLVASAADILTAIQALAAYHEGEDVFTDSWAGWNGVAERTLAVGALNDRWDVTAVYCVVVGGGGAATYRVRISATTGWTNGDVSEHYTSGSTAIADPVADSIPWMPAQFLLTATTLFYRVVPNAGTTTGSIVVFGSKKKAL